MRRAFSFFYIVGSTIILSSLSLIVSFFDKDKKGVHAISRFWAKSLLSVWGVRITVRGLENIPTPPFIFMCNHQSALDIYTLIAGLPLAFKWLAKRELFRIPFIGWAMTRAGYISIDRENPREALKAIDDAGRKIRQGMVIIIFPEGTRSEDGQLLPFKQGVFNLAQRARVPIVPVGIEGTSRLQPKGSFIPKEKGIVYINIGEPVEVGSKGSAEKARLMSEVRDRIEGLMTCRET
ncbi:MAG TPA: lysophospholipid acyltransferase family protein [Syntrophorhabdaceae bacterium]|jgi:1-acyl-sn-glycerol-3-phosphate acyltransferase